MNIYRDVEKLCQYAKRAFRLTEEDEIFSRNLVCGALRIQPAPEPAESDPEPESLSNVDELLAPLVRHALLAGIISEDETGRFDAYLISLFLPRPSSVAKRFGEDVKNLGEKRALANFYQFNIASNYIRMNDVRKNVVWDYSDEEGDIVVTVNKSKPEKDNREIAKLRALAPSAYPACMLCLENLGYAGRLDHPARQNLRVIPLELGKEKWHLQYSPYVYYNEHCIVFSREHRPMNMNRETFVRLAEFVEKFPCYFLGSNAGLPIVGGSILNHEHYQGGGFVMPLHRAAARERFEAEEGLRVEIVSWYASVLRLVSPDKERLVAACAEALEAWQNYSNPALGILARTDAPHNALTPVLRKSGDNFVAELALRNNRTDETYPDGIFHAHPEFQNIKREGIGIIEMLGLFVLPGRLDAECETVANCLAEKKPLPKALDRHREMFSALKEQGPFEDVYAANKATRAHINRACVGILKNTAVFANDEAGQSAFRAFVKDLSFVK